jgi:membrane-associated phospholipid phosphatase
VKSRCRAALWFRAVVVCLGLATSAGAQSDTSTHQRSLFTWRDGVLAGGFVLGTVAIRPLDKTAADLLQTPERQKNGIYKLGAKGFRTIALPGAFIIGTTMYAVGRVTKVERLAQLGLYGTEALVVGEGTGSILKDVVGRARPWVDSVPNPDNWQLLRGFSGGDKFRSFPSGHTVAGFAAAAAVSSEASVWWPHAIYVIGPAMYGGAALIGISRMYDNRHWASDVIMGAAIGTFAGIKVVRYHRTHPDNSLDRWLLRASISPSDPSHISFSLLPALTRR